MWALFSDEVVNGWSFRGSSYRQGRKLSRAENEIGAAWTGFLNSRCCEAAVTFSGSVDQATRRSPLPPLKIRNSPMRPFKRLQEVRNHPF
jgi:hypothetical protein